MPCPEFFIEMTRRECLTCANCHTIFGAPDLQLSLAAGQLTRAEAAASLTKHVCSCGELYCSDVCQKSHWKCVHWLTCVGFIKDAEAATHPLMAIKTLLVQSQRIELDFVLEIICRLVASRAEEKKVLMDHPFEALLQYSEKGDVKSEPTENTSSETESTQRVFDRTMVEKLLIMIDLYLETRTELSDISYQDLLAYELWAPALSHLRPIQVSVEQTANVDILYKKIRSFVGQNDIELPDGTTPWTEAVQVRSLCARLGLDMTLTLDEAKTALGEWLALEDSVLAQDEEEAADLTGEEDDEVCYEIAGGGLLELPTMTGYGYYGMVHNRERVSVTSDDGAVTGQLAQIENTLDMVIEVIAAEDDEGNEPATPNNGSWVLHIDEFTDPNEGADVDEVVNTATIADVISLPNVVSPEECAALIAYLEANVSVDADSVDGLPDYQADLKKPCLATLKEFVRPSQISLIWNALPTLPVGEQDEKVKGQPVPWDTMDAGIFLRKYSPDSRASIIYHEDVSAYTINIALNSDAEYEGGDLVALLQGQKHVLRREQGTVTAHGPNVIHRVEKMTKGSRYSLILFLFNTVDR